MTRGRGLSGAEHSGEQIVDAADSIVAGAGRRLSHDGLFGGLLGAFARRVPAMAEDIPARPRLAALFDALCSSAADSAVAPFFRVVVPPRGVVPEALDPGDIVVTRALGEGQIAHLAVAVTGEIKGSPHASMREGAYMQVIEAGPRPASSARGRMRMLADASGLLSHDRMVVRFAAETVPTPTFHRWQEWHSRAAVSTTYRGPTNADRRVVENFGTAVPAPTNPLAKPSLHLCFQEKACATFSVTVSGTCYAQWEIVDSSGTMKKEHPHFSAANYSGNLAAARITTGRYSWVWDGRDNDTNPVYVAPGTYTSRLEIKDSTGTSAVFTTTIEVQGSPYTLWITGQPKTNAELTTELARADYSGRLLSSAGERVGRDCWLIVHRGIQNDGHVVFLGQGTIEATKAAASAGHGAIATPHGVAYKGWIRADPHGDANRPDRIQIEDVGATNQRITLPQPTGTPTPNNPYADTGLGPWKDGVQAHAGNVWTTDGLSVGCTTSSAITGATCRAPGSVRGAVRSINAEFGTWGDDPSTEDVATRGPTFVNKQSKRATTADAVLVDSHGSPLLDPTGTGCGGSFDEPLHMQSTVQAGVFGGFLGHEIPRSAGVADTPTNRLKIRMTLATYASGSKYHLYHHAVAFGHDWDSPTAGSYRVTLWIPRKLIRGWNGNRRNVLVRDRLQIVWYIEHAPPGGVLAGAAAAAGATSVVHSFRGTGPSTFVALAAGDLGRARDTWTPAAALAAGTYTSVFKYQLDLRPFGGVATDAWVGEPAMNDLFSTHGATLAAETLTTNTAGTRRYASGESRLVLATVP